MLVDLDPLAGSLSAAYTLNDRSWIIAMRWLGTAACAAAVGLTLAGCGSSHRSYVTVPLRAQQTSIVGAYELLHHLGLRVELTQQTAISSL